MKYRVCKECAYAKVQVYDGITRTCCSVKGHRVPVSMLSKCPKGYTNTDIDIVDALCACYGTMDDCVALFSNS